MTIGLTVPSPSYKTWLHTGDIVIWIDIRKCVSLMIDSALVGRISSRSIYRCSIVQHSGRYDTRIILAILHWNATHINHQSVLVTHEYIPAYSLLASYTLALRSSSSV